MHIRLGHFKDIYNLSIGIMKAQGHLKSSSYWRSQWEDSKWLEKFENDRFISARWFFKTPFPFEPRIPDPKVTEKVHWKESAKSGSLTRKSSRPILVSYFILKASWCCGCSNNIMWRAQIVCIKTLLAFRQTNAVPGRLFCKYSSQRKGFKVQNFHKSFWLLYLLLLWPSAHVHT